MDHPYLNLIHPLQNMDHDEGEDEDEDDDNVVVDDVVVDGNEGGMGTVDMDNMEGGTLKQGYTSEEQMDMMLHKVAYKNHSKMFFSQDMDKTNYCYYSEMT